ncbi:hypothetical protein [Luteimonas deserti]|uniref:Cytochrome c n=1 Tax=Luteimonas deserti TaxID=2752306 RepID=A0A7Z0QSQ1_9GAMM|nr:hypothetical protein [Luteimonas deserti]NYZ64181.1 hypothetical protein [Luteimonas deserti]
MSQPPPAASAAARYAVVLVVGLVAGAFLLVAALRAIEARKDWQVHYPHAVMRLFEAQSAQLDALVRAGTCTTSDIAPRLRTLRALADDLDPAFPALRDHPAFGSHGDALRTDVEAMLSAPPASCEALGDALRRIDDACTACHRDVRFY